MSAVPAFTVCDGFTGTTETPQIGFSVTVTLTKPLLETAGYSLYVAVSEAWPLPTLAPVYETVAVVDAPAPTKAEAGDTEHEPRAPLQE
jgi:hypothetical protein